MFRVILKRPLHFQVFGIRTFSTRHNQNILAEKTKRLFSEIDHSQPLSKEEFIKDKCIPFEEFAEQYKEFNKKNGLSANTAFKNLVEGQYNDYLSHLEVIEPGRIC